MAKKYYWLKLQHDFFSNKEIKKLRKIAGGDTYVIIYLKLQLLSLKNEGKLYFEGFEDNVASELALDIDEDEDNVKITFMFLQKYGLIEEISNNEFLLPKTLCSIGKESDSAERVRRHRAKKALQCNGQVTQETLQVTNCNTEIEKEIEKEKEIEIEIETENKKNSKNHSDLRPDYEAVANTFNEICTTLPKIKTMTDKRKKTIKAWLKQESTIDFIEFFNLVNESDFLSGRNGKWDKCCFDWCIKPENRIKILEGNYNNKENQTKQETEDERNQRIYKELLKEQGGL